MATPFLPAHSFATLPSVLILSAFCGICPRHMVHSFLSGWETNSASSFQIPELPRICWSLIAQSSPVASHISSSVRRYFVASPSPQLHIMTSGELHWATTTFNCLMHSMQATASKDCRAGTQPEGSRRIRLRPGLRGPHLSSVDVFRNKYGHETN
jgi:hypothetical protein